MSFDTHAVHTGATHTHAIDYRCIEADGINPHIHAIDTHTTDTRAIDGHSIEAHAKRNDRRNPLAPNAVPKRLLF